MNSEDKPLIMSDEQIRRLRGIKQKTQKPPSNGRGIGIWWGLSGIVLWAFCLLCGLSDWPMWVFRVAGLVLLLFGALMFGVSFEKQGER